MTPGLQYLKFELEVTTCTHQAQLQFNATEWTNQHRCKALPNQN